MVQGDRIRNQSKQGARSVLHPQRQNRQWMPAVSFSGEVIKQTDCLRHLTIHFDRMLTCKTQVESTKPRCKKGLSALKAMAEKGIKQSQRPLFYQSVILSVIDYGLALITMSQSSLRPHHRPSGKASTSRAEGPGFESRLGRDFFRVESYQWLQNWHSSGFPARRLAL